MNRRILWVAGLSLPLLAGCARDNSDLDSFILEVKSRKSSTVEPIPQMQPYEPFAYNRKGDRAPFEPFKRLAPSQTAAVPSNALQPDFSRNREPLESYPLGSLRLHGTLETTRAKFALIQAPDGVVHRVTFGDHMGQNFGKIIDITDAEVTLDEIVPDGFGGYVKRPARVAVSDVTAKTES